MNHWSAVKSLVYKELRLTQMETLACLAAWPVLIGCYALAHAITGNVREPETWIDFAEAAPVTSTAICVGAVIIFGFRELLSDATVREPVFFHMLPVTRRTFWGVKLACGLARYATVFGLGVLVTWGWGSWLAGVPHRAGLVWWPVIFVQVSLVIWYLSCFLATVRVHSHWLWRAMTVLGGLGLSVIYCSVLGDLSQRWTFPALLLLGFPCFVGICFVYSLAIEHVVRFRDVS